MKLSPQQELSEVDIQFGLNAVIRDGIASQAMVTFTSGAFLVAYALKIGASNLTIGLLAAITPLMQLVQIPSIYIVEKLRYRKKISFWTSVISRTFWVPIAVSGMVLSSDSALFVLVTALIFQAGLGAVSACSWNSWMRDLLPQKQLGSFFGRRMRLAMGAGIVLSLAAGLAIDFIKKNIPSLETQGYALLFFLGFLAGILGTYFISTIPEPQMAAPKGRPQLLRLLYSPFKDANFKRLILFLGPWSFATNLSATFFAVYMITRLELSMSLVIILTIVSQVTHMLSLDMWGKFSDRFSNKSVLSVSGPAFMICVFAWTLTTMPEKHVGTVPLLFGLHLFMGLAMAGVTLASGNIALKLAPQQEATGYLAASNLVNSLAAGIGPVLGGLFADFFAKREFALTLSWKSPTREFSLTTLNFQHWDFFFILAFAVGLLALYRLTKVREIGEVQEKVVIHELLTEIRRPLHSLTTIAGIRRMIVFPFSLLKSDDTRSGQIIDTSD